MKQTIKSEDLECIFCNLRNSKHFLFEISRIFSSYNSEECGIDTDANKAWTAILASLEALNDVHDFLLDSYKNV